MEQKQLKPGKLLDDLGRLVESGYSTSPVKIYDRNEIRANMFRIKEWDYYLIHNDAYAVALTIADNSYMGMISVSLMDFTTKKEITRSPMIMFPLGKMYLPSSSKKTDVQFEDDKTHIAFRHEGNVRKLTVEIDQFDISHPVSMEFELSEEPRDSMVIATPFKFWKRAFYYNQKIIGMRARGFVKFNDETIVFAPENSYGLLDWGRGVWTYNNTWFWSAGMGRIDGHTFGFNLGYGFGKNKNATENMLFYDGIAHKLDQVTFAPDGMIDKKPDFTRPWSFTSSDGRFEALFTPILDRKALTTLGIIQSDQHQVFGTFDGKAILDDGQVIVLEHFIGFAEKVHNKW